MTFLDAAYEILKRAGLPLHYTEIADRALTTGLLTPRGQTPEATMGSRLYVDTQRPGSRFRRVGRGIFALTEAQPGDIAHRIDDLNRHTRAELRKRLLHMPADRADGSRGAGFKRGDRDCPRPTLRGWRPGSGDHRLRGR